MNISDAIRSSHANLCLECGKCTGICPVSRFNRGYSPRLLINRSLRGVSADLLKDKNIWTCLTCQLCDEQCPAGVKFVDLIQSIRLEARSIGEEAICSHGGAAQSMMRIMASPDLNLRRLEWLDNSLNTADSGEIMYFAGCLPYFDVLFGDIGVSATAQAKATVQLLNKLGTVPVVLPQERCCGHDLLWQGDLLNFKKLAAYNIALVKQSGAKKIVFSCPECLRTFKLDYPKYFDVNFETYHISEILDKAVSSGKLKFKTLQRSVTYQDPCRLGRHLGIYEAPRRVLSAIPGIELKEMKKNRSRAVCCGVSAWMNCSAFSKQLQLERIKQAKNTGADELVVACPKCEIHFTCAMKESPAVERSDNNIRIAVRNFVSLIAELIWE
ncbi:MAG TPA: (Fe-S)-binding protein [bacterium]